MAAIEPTLDWKNDPLDESADSTDVYVTTEGDDVVVLGARTASGWCFFLRDVMGGADGGTYYDGQAAADGTCTPPSADDIDRPRWSGRVD